MAVVKKDAALKLRLDNLEAELKSLHATILQKRSSKSSLRQYSAITVQSEDTTKTTRKLWLKDGLKQEKQDGKEWFSCLKSITESIARGSNTIKNITSLADQNLSNEKSVTESKTKEDNSSSSDKTFQAISEICFEEELDISDCVKALKRGDLKKGTSNSAGSKNLRKVKSSGSELMAVSTHHSLNECKVQLLKENHMLKQKLESMNNIAEEVTDLKKKLREEKAKRTVVEKPKVDKNASEMQEPTPNKANYQAKKLTKLQNELREERARRMKAEANLVEKTKSATTPTCYENADFMEKVKLKMEYIEEKQRREEVEKELMLVLEKLEESEYRSMDLTESKNIAIALADKFRNKCETYGDVSINKGGGDIELSIALRNQQQQNIQLLNEVRDLKGSQECKLFEKYKHLADSLQEEVNFLQNNMKNPLDDPQVKVVVEKHKNAYAELLHTKNIMESEYEDKFRTFEEELQGLQEIHESKVFELSGLIQNLKIKLQEKNEWIASFSSEQNAYNDAIKRIKSSAGDLSAINKQQDDIIKVLKENIADKEKSLEVMERELSTMHESSESLRKEVEDLKGKFENLTGENNILHDELSKGHDTVIIKEKIIADQLDTIKSLRTMADNTNKTIADLRKERDNLHKKINEVEAVNMTLKETVEVVQEQVNALENYKEGQEKNAHILKQLESQVFQRQKEWESNIAQMCKEKDQAIQTAKFATQKLVQAVNDYEGKLAAQKKLQIILNNAVQEKEDRLNIALQQLELMNDDEWGAQKTSELTRTDLEQKLRRACEVCPDVVDDYRINQAKYSKSS